jgi:hypothetical protein
MARTSKSKANMTKAAERKSGKTKRATIKDLEPTAKAEQQVTGGVARLGLRCT